MVSLMAIGYFLFTGKTMGGRRKFIKRCIKDPENAKCRACKSKLIQHSTKDNLNGWVEAFICTNTACGKRFPIHREKRDKRKKEPTVVKVQEKKEKEPPKIDTENIEFELIHQKILDQFYAVNETMLYNPITGILFEDGVERQATEEEHGVCMQIIREGFLTE